MRTSLITLVLVLAIGCAKPGPESDKQPAGIQHPPTPPATPPAAQQQQVMWTCPMHPDVLMPQAGKCPKCQMDLVQKPMDAPAGGNAAGAPPAGNAAGAPPAGNAGGAPPAGNAPMGAAPKGAPAPAGK